MTSVEVVMSWRPGCPDREANLRWALAQWSLSGWSVALSGATNDGPWCRAADVTPAVEASTADVIIVADADCWTDGIYEAVAAVAAGAPWAVPHLMLCRLGPEATRRVLAGEAPEDQADFAERPYRGHPAGTMFVLRRETYLDCPLDRRFVGWGQEDDAIASALDLLHGKHWRGASPLWHCWHPPQPRRSRSVGNDQNLALYRRYKAARSNPVRMRALIEEAKGVEHAGLQPVALDGGPVPR